MEPEELQTDSDEPVLEERRTPRPQRYKQYLRDPEYPVPKRTKRYWKAQENEENQNRIRNTSSATPPPQDNDGGEIEELNHDGENNYDADDEHNYDEDDENNMPNNTTSSSSSEVEETTSEEDDASEVEESEDISREDEEASGDDNASELNEVDDSRDGSSADDINGACIHMDIELEEQRGASDNSESEEEKDIENGDFRKPITRHSDMKVGQAVTLILAFVMRHTTTRTALQDLLKLLQALLGPNNLPKSLYFFDQYFENVRGAVELHFYCCACHKNLGVTPQDQCSDCHHKKKLKARRNDGDFFILIPMSTQLKKILQRQEIGDALGHRFERTKQNDQNIEDVYDGKLYSESNLKAPSQYWNISITWNTDGVQCSKSSTFSVWPIQFTINELPPKLRRRNVLLAGLWFGYSKPNRDLFYEKFVSQCNELYQNGINWKNSAGHVVNSKVSTLICTCDSPARSLLMNQKQFNGLYGCSWCLHPGERVAKGRGNVRVYPYQDDEAALRTEAQTMNDAREAVIENSVVNGVKGPSPLMNIVSMDCIRAYSVDYLHADLSGVTKATLELWLNPPDKEANYYIGRDMRQINERLLDIKPPNCFPRVPRSLETRANWKAKEYMYWLLYYSLPCLRGILPARYYKHWLLLVHGLSIFLSDSISEKDFEEARNMLRKFVKLYGDLYGIENITSNVHSLVHVPDCVKDMGPLWASSTFIFESNNNSLVKLAHGTQNIPLQIARAFTLSQHLPGLHRHYIQGTKFDELYGKITKNYLGRNVRVLENGVKGYGRPKGRPPTMAEAQALETVIEIPVPEEVVFFRRITVDGVMYHSKQYKKPRKRKSFFVKLKNNRFARISIYCLIERNVYALYDEAVLRRGAISVDTETGAHAGHIHIMDHFLPQMRAIKAVEISSKCLVIEEKQGIHNKTYFIEIANKTEFD